MESFLTLDKISEPLSFSHIVVKSGGIQLTTKYPNHLQFHTQQNDLMISKLETMNIDDIKAATGEGKILHLFINSS